MKIPTTLKHKPVIVSENYEGVDGRYAYNTDAKGLSLGLAQWNDRGKVAVCTDNEKINEDIKLFSQALSNDDELIGERLRTLSSLLKERGY